MSGKKTIFGYEVVDASALRRSVRQYAGLTNWDGDALLTVNDNRRCTVDFSGSCESPVEITRIARRKSYEVMAADVDREPFRYEPDIAKRVGLYSRAGRELAVERQAGDVRVNDPRILVSQYRCRICDRCLEAKSSYWCCRAEREFSESAVTWMMTITLSPDEHARLDVAAMKRWHARETGRAPSPKEFLQCRMSVFREWFYLWLRAVEGRGRSAWKRSYCCVVEVHDSEKTSAGMRGRPHLHVLIHERFVGALFDPDDYEIAVENDREVCRLADDSRPRKLWPKGFTKIVRCDDQEAVTYVMKYLHLSIGYRVGASFHYGEPEVTLTALRQMVRAQLGVVPSTLLGSSNA